MIRMLRDKMDATHLNFELRFLRMGSHEHRTQYHLLIPVFRACILWPEIFPFSLFHIRLLFYRHHQLRPGIERDIDAISSLDVLGLEILDVGG